MKSLYGMPSARGQVLALVQRGHDHEEQQREHEREDPAPAVTPVGALLVADLPPHQAEVAS